MIEFRKITAHNFMSYRHMNIQLSNLGVVRIEGVNNDEPGANSNMAGKSTIMEALLWCLFGRTLRGLRHEAIVNRKAKRNCFVSTTFTHEGISYLCRRNRKHKRFSNKLLLYRRDILISSRHESDTQRSLESILDCDYESFVNSVVFGGFDGNKKQFALQTDSQQKQVFDSFLRFEKFELALKRTKRLLLGAKEQHHQLQINLEKQHGVINTFSEKIKTIKTGICSLEKTEHRDKKKILREIKSLSESKTVSEKELKHNRDKVEKIINKKAGVEARMEALQHQLRILDNKQLNKKRMVGKPCPICGRTIKEKTISLISHHFNLERIKLKEKERTISRFLKKVERRAISARLALSHMQKKYEASNLIRSRRKELENKLQEAKTLKTPFSEELEKAQVRYSKEVSRQLVYEYEEQLLKQKIKDLEFWERGFGNKGVKTLVVREVLPSLNNKIKEYANEIFQSGVELEFKTTKASKSGEERELFYLHYNSRRNANSYIGESSGGRRRVDICVLLCFAWLSRICNLILCDELLDGLDESGKETVLEILAKQRATVLVISHERDLKSKIGRVWTVRKSNGISTLEENG